MAPGLVVGRPDPVPAARTPECHSPLPSGPLPDGPLPWRAVVADWPVADRERWGRMANEFAQAGLPVCSPAVTDVEVGIGRVYALLKSGRLVVSKACPHLIDDLCSYSRPVDDEGEPMEGIQDKEIHHLADSLRYLASHLHSDAKPAPPIIPRVIPRSMPTLGGFHR